MKCGHDECRCSVVDGERFCSDHCREEANAEGRTHACKCGHPTCQDAESRETERNIQEAFQ